MNIPVIAVAFECAKILLSLVCCLLPLGQAAAAPPAQLSAFGIALGAPPESVMSQLTSRYPSCRPIRSFYRDRPGENTRVISEIAINPGTSSNDPATKRACEYSPAGDGVLDAVEARFTHSDVAAEQPLHWLEVFREYPDVVLDGTAKSRLPFEQLRSELFRMYGKPNDEKRQRGVSAAASRSISLGVKVDSKREDHIVRYLWSGQGERLPEVDDESHGCDCASPYVKAVIEITRSPSTRPKNAFHVLSVKLLVEDPGLRQRQSLRDAAWRKNR